MATIKAIEALSVHRIQSGQVIVDLCSVVKELVENSIDAGATSVEIRFKNQGLDSIEVADNGSGISKDDYESVALKHYTSKLRSYDDLERLDTFGFRGEALSSLCAVAQVHIITAQAHEAPKATRLDFENTGRLKESTLLAGLKGTTVSVENIFKPLPVRRQDLTKNIKREYTKVLNLLQSYACISTTARITVSNVAAKGKKSIVFATKANQNSRENIANIFGVKTTASLIPLDLEFELQASTYNAENSKVKVKGHVSKPTVGEGRQMADRQMFFVNGRPCALPQVGKAMNEVYKIFNMTQSPFIFADLELDTNSYDVNVSPDKRTILLHEQGALLESLKSSLLDLFESHEQSMPHGQANQPSTYSAFKRPSFSKQPSGKASDQNKGTRSSGVDADISSDTQPIVPDDLGSTTRGEPSDLVQTLFTKKVSGLRADQPTLLDASKNAGLQGTSSNSKASSADHSVGTSLGRMVGAEGISNDAGGDREVNMIEVGNQSDDEELFLQEKDTQKGKAREEEPIPSTQTTVAKHPPGPIPSAFDRMRPLRTPIRQAVITIGDQTMTKTIGGPSSLKWTADADGRRSKAKIRTVSARSSKPSLLNSLRAFAAPGTQADFEAPEPEGHSQDDQDDQEPPRKLRKRDTETDDEPQSDAGSPRVSRKLGQGSKDDSREADTGLESSDGEYLDEEEERAKEEARVAQLIEQAEKKAIKPSDESIKRASRLLKGGNRDSTTRLQLPLEDTTQWILEDSKAYQKLLKSAGPLSQTGGKHQPDLDISAEEKLSLTISKEDFEQMRVAGQFNLGFIIATRPSVIGDKKKKTDELFIIDQHASDEKFNFERLQATTQVENQPLVHHQRLDLTAVEEEILIENQETLLKNGFEVEIDESGDYPVGRRCTLVSLPMSKEVTFSTQDLEELIAMLAENPNAQMPTLSNMSLDAPAVPSLNRERSSFVTPVIRPTKVRKMFAMRACRSSIMIGKTLTGKQMRGLVDNMGKMDKPWNCPHGRPTMRHLYSFANWKGWNEDDEASAGDDQKASSSTYSDNGKINWAAYLNQDASDTRDEENDSDEYSDDEENGTQREMVIEDSQGMDEMSEIDTNEDAKHTDDEGEEDPA